MPVERLGATEELRLGGQWCGRDEAACLGSWKRCLLPLSKVSHYSREPDVPRAVSDLEDAKWAGLVLVRGKNG